MRKLYPWLALLALAGCKQAPELPAAISPFKIDIQQGNVLTQEMLAKLKAGMTRAQVRFALGSPLIVDAFHTDRWDYVYSLEKQGKSIERRRVTVIFDDDKLLRLEGDILPVDPSLISDRPVQPRAPAASSPAAVPGKPPAAKPPIAAQPATKPAAPVAAPAAPANATAKPTEQPLEKPPVAPVAADKPGAPASKPEATTATQASDAAPAEAAKADAPIAPAETKKVDTAKTEMPKEKPKGGFFGRMLDKIGF